MADVKFDVELARNLLEIADYARDYPNLKPLADAAQEELAQIAAKITEEIEKAKEEKDDATRHSSGVRSRGSQTASSARL